MSIINDALDLAKRGTFPTPTALTWDLTVQGTPHPVPQTWDLIVQGPPALTLGLDMGPHCTEIPHRLDMGLHCTGDPPPTGDGPHYIGARDPPIGDSFPIMHRFPVFCAIFFIHK